MPGAQRARRGRAAGTGVDPRPRPRRRARTLAGRTAGKIDSRPEPARPATPTISPWWTSAVTSTTLPPATSSTVKRGVPLCGGLARARGPRATRPTISSTRQSWSSSSTIHGGDPPAVAQHGDGSAIAEDLVEVMRDEHDADAALAQAADHAEEVFDVVGGQRGGGLVEHEDLGGAALVVDGAGDGDDRCGRRPQRSRAVRTASTSSPRSAMAIPRRPSALRPPADPPEAVGAVAAPEHDVLDHVERRHQPEVLVDEAQPEPWPAPGDTESQRLARARRCRAGIGRVVAGEDLDQRRLAGPVLADEGVDLARADVMSDAVEDDLTGERLREPVDLEHRLVPGEPAVSRRHPTAP